MSPSLNVFLRFLWYIVSRLLIWGAVIGLVALAFFAAMDYMNIQTLVKDGLHVRAGVVIQNEDPTLLSKVFSKSFLEKDDLLKSTAYQHYDVKNFDYKADVGFALILPWNNSVTLRVTEEVTGINADVYAASKNTEDVSDAPPQWDNAVYDLTVTRFEDNWRIVGMELVELLPKPTPSPTKTPSESPTPSPTEEIINPEDIIED